MNRYIDADIAKEKLKEYCVDDDSTVQYWYDLMGIDDCIDENIPTADVVEVVRCKDCKHHYTWTDVNGCLYHSCDRRLDAPWYDSCVCISDYCSYGERKEA